MAVADKLKALQIKVNVIADREVGLMDIEAEVHGGIAVLTGEVETEEQKQIAEQLAYEVDGVEEVTNEINVTSRQGFSPELDTHLGFAPIGDLPTEQPMDMEEAGYVDYGPRLPASEQFPGEFTDEEIAREVKDRLARSQDADYSNVIVSSINQMVHLSGSVKTLDELNRLQDLVISARGVMGIDSGVSVDEDEEQPPDHV